MFRPYTNALVHLIVTHVELSLNGLERMPFRLSPNSLEEPNHSGLAYMA